jgi:ketosteroid isomerase-like protein
MKLIRSALPSALRVLTLVLACSALPGHADEYADVTQLLRLNKPNDALAMADRFLASKPQDAQMRFLKGVIQRTLGKQAEAIATFTKLTEDYPELPEPYNNLAVLYAGQGQYDKARVALEMAIRTNPSYATAHENIGDVYSRLASQAYNKALQLDGSNPAVPPKLALIREIFKPNLPGAVPASPASIAAAAAASAQAAAKPVVAATQPVSKPTVVVAEPPKPVVVATAPVATPVATPAPAPAPVKAEARPSADAGAAASAEAAVQSWAQAWANKNMQAYLAAYSPQFAPAGQSHSDWAKERTARIVGKSSISVALSDLELAVEGDKAVARFRQAYKADTLNVTSRKTLELQHTGGRWLITKEVSGS